MEGGRGLQCVSHGALLANKCSSDCCTIETKDLAMYIQAWHTFPPSSLQPYLLFVTAHCLSLLSLFKTPCKSMITIFPYLSQYPYTFKQHLVPHLLRDPTVSLLLGMVSSVLWALDNEQHMHTYVPHNGHMLDSTTHLPHYIPVSGPRSKKGSDITVRWKPPSRDVPARKRRRHFNLRLPQFTATDLTYARTVWD